MAKETGKNKVSFLLAAICAAHADMNRLLHGDDCSTVRYVRDCAWLRVTSCIAARLKLSRIVGK